MTGPSIFLYHPVFLQFRKMMHEEAQNIPPEFRVEVYQFMNKAAAIYNTENIRRVSVEEPLGSLLGRAIIATQLPDGTSNDGCILTSVSDHLALCLLLEMKNEVGTGGCDPAAQGSYSTRKFWASDKGRYFRSNTCSPTFILAMPGPWLQVQGFVLVDDAVAQPLTDYIWLGGDADIEAQIDKVAKVLFALKRSLESLETYYQYLSPSPDPGNIAYLNPCITSYSTDTESMEFTYNGRMFPRGSRAVFSAQSFSGLNLVVKFTTKYNCDAHRLLANSGLAPKLYYASSCPAVPGYTMVVMERIGMDATVLGWQARTEEMYKTVEQAVHLLHASDYVFGDLRLVNIVVDKGGGVYLVDFDWCGKENVDRYPATLNDTGAIVWAKGVRRGALMRKEHDLEMLDRLKSDFLAVSLSFPD
ncbi:hypothetical protein M408DRAFT_73816 [Serendipita vermifera MAFF 305830]|uniref:Protein kinase domain-containing protein n=1 Tax=Serendipita vermifera MAFF 305830 TaxID=933852 RepID=A0A0C3B0N3_SERVB|nr:hypothetical protein M408DRAFT_73816 [Serendipita vermifera MAFF 305830]